MAQKVVGLAELHVASSPDTITTIGLGSCVGVTLYDPVLHIGGLVHVMLPTSQNDPRGNPAKYADIGVLELIRRMRAAGCRTLHAKMAGGANMFAARQNNYHMIGQRNAIVCREVLEQQRIPIKAEDTGGTFGRTIELDTATGLLKIRTVGFGEKTV